MKKVSSANISQLQQNKMDKQFYNTEGVKNADECKFQEAIEWFSKAVELEPEDALSYFNRATVKMEMGNIAGARADFKLSEKFRPGAIIINELVMN